MKIQGFLCASICVSSGCAANEEDVIDDGADPAALQVAVDTRSVLGSVETLGDLNYTGIARFASDAARGSVPSARPEGPYPHRP